MTGRLLSLLPGVRATKRQVEIFAEAWRSHNDNVLATLSANDRLLVALGDSLTQGIGASSIETNWVLSLADRLHTDESPVRVINLSESGGKIDDVMHEQLPRLTALDRPPAVVACTVGSNDLIGSPRFAATVDRMRALLDALPETAVIATIPDRGSLIAKAFNRRLRSAAEEASVRLAEVAPLAYRGRRTYAKDFFHPNDNGYEAWLSAFAAALDG
ncbi:MAG: SGNH/GDSL hydrolase family protein [Acidimicrobiia bacterium]|nr:SGNH/GDSL hydrolase family protein [Acidimicrobiia bacterium]